MSYTNTPFELNGVSFSDAKVTFNGLNLPGIRGLNVTVQQDKANKFGAGVYPVARGRTVKDPTGSLDMDLETRNLLKNTFAPLTELTDVPPGVLTVIFDNGVQNIIINITAVEFLNDGLETSQGDDEVVRSYDIVCGVYTDAVV